MRISLEKTPAPPLLERLSTGQKLCLCRHSYLVSSAKRASKRKFLSQKVPNAQLNQLTMNKMHFTKPVKLVMERTLEIIKRVGKMVITP